MKEMQMIQIQHNYTKMNGYENCLSHDLFFAIPSGFLIDITVPFVPVYFEKKNAGGQLYFQFYAKAFISALGRHKKAIN